MTHPIVVQKSAALGRKLWTLVPPPALETPLFRGVGHLIHHVVRQYSHRSQSLTTYFLRNLPLIETVAEQMMSLHPSGAVRLLIIGCSTGAEVYSVIWKIRLVSPLALVPVAMDISASAVEQARSGCYRIGTPELRKELPDEVLHQIFDRHGDDLKVKPWISQGIQWRVADARDPGLRRLFGRQDIVLANNFLVRMEPKEARACMANLLPLVRPGGLFVCRGVDLDIRESTMLHSGFQPLTTRLAEIHNADRAYDAPKDWPLKYWGLEPLNQARKNWTFRYAAIFRRPLAA